MSPEQVAAQEKELKRRGVLSLNHSQFKDYFDFQARELVGKSGSKVLKTIKAGKAKSNLRWRKLVLLSGLFDK